MRIITLAAIMLCLSSVCQAEPTTFKDWFVDAGDGFVYAATINSSGSTLGQYCYNKDDTCYYLIGFDIKCTKDNKYPVLVNSDAGALYIEPICDAPIEASGNYRYFIKFDEIDKVIKTGSVIGFAFPMQGDQFKAFRFSLDGAKDSITFMRRLVGEAIDRKKGTPEKGDLKNSTF